MVSNEDDTRPARMQTHSMLSTCSESVPSGSGDFELLELHVYLKKCKNYLQLNLQDKGKQRDTLFSQQKSTTITNCTVSGTRKIMTAPIFFYSFWGFWEKLKNDNLMCVVAIDNP